MGRQLVSAGTLFVVATPLGNLGDLSDRARDVLRRVALVAAEDTRRTKPLLQHLDAHPRVVSYHAHSPPARVAQLLDTLREGACVALVSDAGTPTVSDPGADLVARARAAGIPVIAIPGPSAVAAALSISGLSADRYLFLGFLPRRGGERRTLLGEIATSERTVVLFESAQRLDRLLAELATICAADRVAAVARELTKVHEELKTGTINELRAYYEEHPPRGEVTVLVAAARSEARAADRAAVAARAQVLLAEGKSRRDTAQQVAAEFAVSKREAYRVVMEQ